MITSKNAAAIVLAAGRSTRFGANNKLLHKIDGVPIVRLSMAAACGAGLTSVIVVTGVDADAVTQALDGLDICIVRNATPDAGMGTSLAAGANAVADDIDALFIALGDMPRMKSKTYSALLAGFDPPNGHDIVVPVHDGRRGHPVLFGRRYFSQLCGLDGDAGAKSLLKAYPERVHAVTVDDPGALMDIDTLDDLAG